MNSAWKRSMNPQEINEHNRLFQMAMTIVKNEIPLLGQTEMSVPGIGLTDELRYAIVLFERALEINPQNWSAMWYIGKVHQRLREPAEALGWFERSHRSNPSQADVVREASLSAMEIGCNNKAISFALRAVELQPTSPGLCANLALAYLLAGHLSEAEVAIRRAVIADPSDPISQTIQIMVKHFANSGRVPPTTTTALQDYWTNE
jgi:tetratricopeptide (TPR) repeat protein